MDYSRTLLQQRPTIGELIFSKEDDVGFYSVFLINGGVVVRDVHVISGITVVAVIEGIER